MSTATAVTLAGSFIDNSSTQRFFNLNILVDDTTNIVQTQSNVGTVTINSVSYQASIEPPGTFGQNDNIFYFDATDGQYFTGFGLSFVANSIEYNLFLEGGSTVAIYTDNDFVGLPVNLTSTCVLDFTPILTPDGYVPIKFLKAGDKIISHDGLILTILSNVTTLTTNKIKNLPYVCPKGFAGALSDTFFSEGHAFILDGKYTKPREAKLKRAKLEDLNKFNIYKIDDICYRHLELQYDEGDRRSNYYIANGVKVESYSTLP